MLRMLLVTRTSLRLADIVADIDFRQEAWQVADELEDAWCQVYGIPWDDDAENRERFHRWFDTQMRRLV